MSTIYISDLDGTLLRNNATLSDFSRNTLSELLHDGLPFTVASARSVVSMRPMLAGLKLSLPIIEFNGAFISDLESGQHHIINHIERPIVEDLYQLILTFGCIPFISSFNGLEDCLYYSDIINQGMQWYLKDRLRANDKRLRSIKNLIDSFHDQIVCLVVIGQANTLASLEDAIKERYANYVETYFYENQYFPDWHWLTIHHHKASKDQAIRMVLKEFGLQNSELVVFGDQNNDIKMFQLADRAVAVANASAELKRYATHVIGSNQEDSVVKFIRDDWKGQQAIDLPIRL